MNLTLYGWQNMENTEKGETDDLRFYSDCFNSFAARLDKVWIDNGMADSNGRYFVCDAGGYETDDDHFILGQYDNGDWYYQPAHFAPEWKVDLYKTVAEQLLQVATQISPTTYETSVMRIIHLMEEPSGPEIELIEQMQEEQVLDEILQEFIDKHKHLLSN